MLRIGDVLRMTALSRSELYRRIAAGLFPKQRKLSERVAAWPASEVQAWIASLSAAPAPRRDA